ncbi:hypothetical protein Hanom_Chr17g01562251 [Helianthus anomalus]
MNYRTRYQTFTNISERTQSLLTFVYLTKRMNFFAHVRSFIKQTNTNKFRTKWFTNCSLSVRFICTPHPRCGKCR